MCGVGVRGDPGRRGPSTYCTYTGEVSLRSSDLISFCSVFLYFCHPFPFSSPNPSCLRDQRRQTARSYYKELKMDLLAHYLRIHLKCRVYVCGSFYYLISTYFYSLSFPLLLFFYHYVKGRSLPRYAQQRSPNGRRRSSHT